MTGHNIVNHAVLRYTFRERIRDPDHTEDIMTPNQRAWAQARDRLELAVSSLGYPEELAGLLAKQLKSPKAIDRMASYLRLARPGNLETIVDEMLAICADTEAWREKIESREAQMRYSAWLNSEERAQIPEEESREQG